MTLLLPDDAVVVTKLDRLARSSRDLHNVIGEFAREYERAYHLAGAARPFRGSRRSVMLESKA